MMKIFPILLTFYHKLVLREGIFGTAASLNKQLLLLCKQLLFQLLFCVVFFFFAKRETWKKDVKKFLDKVSMFIIHESMKGSSDLKMEVFQKIFFF